MAEVGFADVTHAWRHVTQTEEGLVGVCRGEELVKFVLLDRPARGHVAADQLTLIDRDQMRHESQPVRSGVGVSPGAGDQTELLGDLGPVAMAGRLVGVDVLGDGHEGGTLASAPAGTGNTGLGVDHHVFDQPGPGQWSQGKDGGRRVTTGVGDEFRLPDPLAVELGESIGRSFEQVRLAMRSVVLLVGRQVLEAEVG